MTIGILSNAPIDIVARVDNDFLAEFDLIPSICTPVDWEDSQRLEARLLQLASTSTLCPGGCGANIAVWLKMFGLDPTIVAPFARDAIGRMMRSSLADRQINCLGYDYDGAQSRAYTLITDDRERTFASVRGDVPTDLLADILRHLEGERYFLIDGYYLENEGAIDGILSYLENIRPASQKIILCPNDKSVIVEHSAAIARLVELCDYIIMNESEAETLFKGASDIAIADYMRDRGQAGAITNGVYGATIFDSETTLSIEGAVAPRPKVNTNGAGDAFTAGFIAGLLWGYDLAGSGEIGRLCAGEILTVTSARPELFQAKAVLKSLGRNG